MKSPTHPPFYSTQDYTSWTTKLFIIFLIFYLRYYIPWERSDLLTTPMKKKLALSIKCNHNYFSQPQLDDIYKYIISFYKRIFGIKLVQSVYELDSKGKLHYHGIIMSPSHIKYPQFFIKGFMIYVKKITDLPGWMKYIYKNPLLCLETSHFNVRSEYEFNSTTQILNHLQTISTSNGLITDEKPLSERGKNTP